jgi:transcriptional antiterminator RfaH
MGPERMRRWYVAMTHAKSEEVAYAHLERQGFQAYLPRYKKQHRHARRTTEVKAPLFPGYLFVNIDMGAERWRPIRSTMGIRDIICLGDLPTPVPEGVVEEIRLREDETGIVPFIDPVPYKKGDTVKVLSGPMRDAVGWFEKVADKDRIIILLEMLGRQIRMPIKRGAVRSFT